LNFTAFDPGYPSSSTPSHFETAQHDAENCNPVKFDMSWSPHPDCNRISNDLATNEGATFVSRPNLFVGFEVTNNNLDWELHSQTNPDPSPETQALIYSSQGVYTTRFVPLLTPCSFTPPTFHFSSLNAQLSTSAPPTKPVAYLSPAKRQSIAYPEAQAQHLSSSQIPPETSQPAASPRGKAEGSAG